MRNINRSNYVQHCRSILERVAFVPSCLSDEPGSAAQMEFDFTICLSENIENERAEVASFNSSYSSLYHEADSS